ncbi:MAG: lactonase family protein [Anaerolineales bacterium]
MYLRFQMISGWGNRAIKSSTLPGFLAALVFSSSASAMQYFVYVGSYTAEPSSGTPPTLAAGRAAPSPSTSKGIYGWRFDTITREVSPLGLVAETANPAQISVSPNGKFLYAVNWQESSAAVSPGISAFAIDRKTGALTFLNKAGSAGELPNQVVLSPTGDVAAVVNYKTGNMALLPVRANGSLGEPFAVSQSEGKPTSPRGDGPHAHGVIFTLDGRWLFEAELGLDRVYSFRIDSGRRALTALDPAYVALPVGSGPRRLQLSPDQRFLYVNRQNDNKVSVFAIDQGRLSLVQEIDSDPKDTVHRGGSAEIQIDHDGRFLFVSLRGSSTIAVNAIDRSTGKLTLLENVPARGVSPRNITISPDNNFLFAANQASNTITVFAIDHRTGHLDPVDAQMTVSQPGGISFVTLGD